MQLRDNRTPRTPDGRPAPTITENHKRTLGIQGMRVRTVIGSGSYGTVVLYQSAKQKVAVKSMSCKKESQKHDARQEVMMLKLLQSCPYAIDYIADLVDEDSVHHVVMDSALKDFTAILDNLSARKAKAYYKQLISGVTYMHNMGFAHRDLKTPNLLLGRDGLLKICDFNMAVSFLNEDSVSLYFRGVCGTEEYQPPEMLVEHDSYCPRSYDIWSCGIIFYEFFAADLPWDYAKESQKSYLDFANGVPNPALNSTQEAFFRFVCHLDWAKRPRIKEIADHPFLKDRARSTATPKTPRTPLGPAQLNTPAAAPRAQKRKAPLDTPVTAKRANLGM